MARTVGFQGLKIKMSSSEEDEPPVVQRRGNSFGLLGLAGDEADDSDASASASSEGTESNDDSDGKQHSKAKGDSSDEFEELERQFLASRVDREASRTRQDPAFRIDPDWLDPSVELRRKISGKPRQERAAQCSEFSGKLVAMKNKRWLPFAPDSIGLAMCKEGAFFYYEPTETYESIYAEFEATVELADIVAVSDFLRKHPNNPDALLCLVDAADRMGASFGMSAIELVQRVIQVMERLFHADFRLAQDRLPYDHLHNRKLHIALFRYVQLLIKQGCWRTALQVSKALYTLDPERDPLASRLFIEFLAVQCEDGELLDRFCLGRPNKALSEFLSLGASGADALLVKACEASPFAASELAKACGFEKTVQIDNLTEDSIADASVLLEAKIFAARNVPLWKQPTALSWFKRTLHSIALVPHAVQDRTLDSAVSVYRHAIISDLKLAYSLPRSITSVIGDTMHSYDPLPPEDVEILRDGRPQGHPSLLGLLRALVGGV